MAKKVISKRGATGTIYDYHFQLKEESGRLDLVDVKVHGESIIEVMDQEILDGVYNEQHHNWINQEV